MSEPLTEYFAYRNMMLMDGGVLGVNPVPVNPDERFYAAAEVERVLKEAKQLAQFLVDLGFQTESTELNLTTPEFTEVWKQAQRLLERLR